MAGLLHCTLQFEPFSIWSGWIAGLIADSIADHLIGSKSNDLVNCPLSLGEVDAGFSLRTTKMISD